MTEHASDYISELLLLKRGAEHSLKRGSPLESQLVAAWLLNLMVDEILEKVPVPPIFRNTYPQDCKYLGRHRDIYDLYMSEDESVPLGNAFRTTFIARWSDRRQDYKAITVTQITAGDIPDHDLKEARDRAVVKGWFVP